MSDNDPVVIVGLAIEAPGGVETADTTGHSLRTARGTSESALTDRVKHFLLFGFVASKTDSN